MCRRRYTSRLDGMAKLALRRQISYEEPARTLEVQVQQQRELADKLKDGLEQLRLKREELVQKWDELVSRAKMAGARIQVQQAVRSVSMMDPSSALRGFEERVRRGYIG